MEEQLKKTLAVYLKTEPSAIGNDTVIDRSALGNSILLHRLYASFSQQGYSVSNYNTVRTFGDLKTRLSQINGATVGTQIIPVPSQNGVHLSSSFLQDSTGGGLGIDIESIENFEVVQDYRENIFYKENFSPREISYCLLQHDARISLAGLFAAKEALIKADNSLAGVPFNAFEIEHDKNGKPFFKNFTLSISHAGQYATAVAFKSHGVSGESTVEAKPFLKTETEIYPNQKKAPLLSYVVLVFSLLALILASIALLKR